jgi:hypothetical protein
MKTGLGLEELAQYTYAGLEQAGIDVTLSGGACVSIYTHNAYQSYGLDFIRQLHDGIEKVAQAMVVRDNPVDKSELKRWAAQERMLERYAVFEEKLHKAKAKKDRKP